jgi:hypothetical protein
MVSVGVQARFVIQSIETVAPPKPRTRTVARSWLLDGAKPRSGWNARAGAPSTGVPDTLATARPTLVEGAGAVRDSRCGVERAERGR